MAGLKEPCLLTTTADPGRNLHLEDQEEREATHGPLAGYIRFLFGHDLCLVRRAHFMQSERFDTPTLQVRCERRAEDESPSIDN